MNDHTHEYDSHSCETHSCESHWRDTQLPPMFWIFNGYLIFLFLGVAIIPTFTLKGIIAVLILIVIGILKFAEARGLTPSRATKAIRSLLASKKRPAWNPIHDRHSIDHTPLPFCNKFLRATK